VHQGVQQILQQVYVLNCSFIAITSVTTEYTYDIIFTSNNLYVIQSYPKLLSNGLFYKQLQVEGEGL